MVLRIFKMIATSGFPADLECSEFVFGRGSARTPLGGGAYSAPSDPLAGLRGPTSKEGEWRGRGKREKKRGRGRGQEGPVHSLANSGIRP